jgi:hypothetical protein
MPYIRKYAGPLQPWRKSAYVPGTRKKAKTAKPSRFPSGKVQYRKSRALSKKQSATGESKIQALTEFNKQEPLPLTVAPAVGPVYFTNYCLGTAPAAWEGPDGAANFNDLNGFLWVNGTGPNERIGRYMYLKRTTLQLRVEMDQISRHGPVRFRLIVYKEKRNRYNSAGNGNPNADLFIDHSGNDIGFNTVATPSAQAQSFNTYLVNKRNYQVVKDTKFTLCPEQNSASGSALPFNVNQHNKSFKDITLRLGHYQKAAFGRDNNPFRS